jgi:hypothetical protein
MTTPIQRLAPVLALGLFGCALGAAAAGSCQLGSAHNPIRHVVYVQFDNTHLKRDNPNVPSDLEQMPHLLDFMRGSGTLLANDHTILISHTAGGFLSSFTGLYPDRHGQIVSNSNVRISGTGTFSFPSSFGYWTDPVAATTTIPNMVGPDGTNTPAPWVTFTRAGCDFGAVGGANIVLENTGTGASGDITKVFGTGSPQWNEASNSATRVKASADFVGLAVHCAAGSTNCATGVDDILPAEPGGYTGFKALFGAQTINPLLTGHDASVPLTDLSGNPITDPAGNPGFPGFDGMLATVSLAYAAAMQEKGIAITYVYVSDAHDNHATHLAMGPGDAAYVAQLKAYDDAFAAFFARLAADGIDKSNTLFIFTVDEGDHFVGVQKAGCDGVHTPCAYGPNEIGEISANIDTLVTHQFPALAAKFLGTGAPDAFTVHGDDAPTFYLAKVGTGALAQTDPDTRQFERSMATITNVNPYTHATDRLLVRMADQAGMKAMHMYTAGDPARNPTFVFFADDNYFITDFPTSTCESCINPAFAWNHGDDQQEIASTWLGFVGPGVRADGQRSDVWTDHVDVRPTILTLAGLADPYQSDGRAVIEAIDDAAVPQTLRAHRATLTRLGAAYKQLNAPFGTFAQSVLVASTAALASNFPNDAIYTAMEAGINAATARRDALAGQIKTVLAAATFSNQALDEQQAKSLIAQADALVAEAALVAAAIPAP